MITNNNMRLSVAYVFICLALFFVGCSKKTTVQTATKKQPAWVTQRPVSNLYYVGIGYAAKSNHNDFTQAAKKNALQDLLGEIKVTVSSNSLLSQYEQNNAISQQFFSDIKVNIEGSIEGFEVVDAFETKTEYWIYYRLDKAKYELAQRRKMEAAIEKALDYLKAADALNAEADFSQIFRLRVKALAALQNYANNNLEAIYRGRQVFLLNEIVGLMQRQLYLIKLNAKPDRVIITAGRALAQPIEVIANMQQTNKPLAFVPLTWQNKQGRITGTHKTETNQNGNAAFFVTRVVGTNAVQMVDFKVDVQTYFLADSFNAAMRRIIESFDVPFTKVQFMVEPIKIYVDAEERNLDKPLDFNMLETNLKKQLSDQGCTFVKREADAQYVLHIRSNTKDEGVIWGKMLQSTLEARIWITDVKSGAEVYKDALKSVKGFQLVADKAGLDAYANGITELNKNLLPRILSVLVLE